MKYLSPCLQGKADFPGGPVVPVQGTWVQSLVQEDPTCLRATKRMSQNSWSLGALEPVLRNREKPPQWEARTPQLEKARHSSTDPAQPHEQTKTFQQERLSGCDLSFCLCSPPRALWLVSYSPPQTQNKNLRATVKNSGEPEISPTCELICQPATISWMLVRTWSSWVSNKDSMSLTATAVATVSALLRWLSKPRPTKRQAGTEDICTQRGVI